MGRGERKSDTSIGLRHEIKGRFMEEKVTEVYGGICDLNEGRNIWMGKFGVGPSVLIRLKDV